MAMCQTPLKFVSMGFGYILCANRVVSVLPNRGEQPRRMARFAKKAQTYLDMTRGRETKSFILMDDGSMVGCAFSPPTVLKRLNGEMSEVPMSDGMQSILFEEDDNEEEDGGDDY